MIPLSDGRDWSEALDHVVAIICGETKKQSVAEQQQRVTIRISSRHGLCPDRHAATRSIFDDHALAETGLQLLGDHPTESIHRRSWRNGYNDLNGPARILLSVSFCSEPERKTDRHHRCNRNSMSRHCCLPSRLYRRLLSPLPWDHFSGIAR